MDSNNSPNSNIMANKTSSPELICKNCGEVLKERIDRSTIPGKILTVLGIGLLITSLFSLPEKGFTGNQIFILVIAILMIWSGTVKKSYLKCSNCGCLHPIKK